MWAELLKGALFSFGSVFFFSIVFRAPRRTQAVCALFGALCYTIFSFLKLWGVSLMLAYFFSTLLLAILCEAGAILLKAPATVFLSTSVLGLVPGLDLYRTMSLLTAGDTEQGAQIGIQTLLEIAIMAMAMAIGLFAVRQIRSVYRTLCRRKAKQ